MDIIIFKSFIPEIFLSLAILFQLVFNARIINTWKYNFPVIDREIFCQTGFILVCLFFLFSNLKIEGFFSNFLFVNDQSSIFCKTVIVSISLAILGILLQSFSLQKLNFFEFFNLFLLSILSLLLLVSSSDLISFYLLIEMQALCFYVLATFKKNSAFSTEAGLKYFVTGSFISGFFLFGASLIYGCLGTLNLTNINLLLAFPFSTFNSELKLIILVGIIFVTVTLLFKIAAAPFHFWAPDVYEGSPLSSTIIFSIVPKIAIFYFFIKWISAINIFFFDIQSMLMFFGVFSTFVGTFFALSQKRLKRLVIYSSIAQIGFLVAGLSLNNLGGFISVYFFLIIYILTSILIWGHFTLFYSFQSRIDSFYNRNSNSLFISNISNFAKSNSLWAFSFVIIFFSIAGIPPLTGFLAKIMILFDLIDSNFLYIAISLILLSSISVFYYIKVIKIMFFEPNKLEKNKEKFQVVFFSLSLDSIYLLFTVCLFILIILFFYPNVLFLLCQYIVFSGSQF
jgi:NADH-quinone oxidoreductase subunit N